MISSVYSHLKPVYVRSNQIFINPEAMEDWKWYEFTFKGKRMRTRKKPDGMIEIYEEENVIERR